MRIGEIGFQLLADALCSAPASAISYLDVSGNAIGRAMHSFSRCLLSRGLRKLRFLALAGVVDPPVLLLALQQRTLTMLVSSDVLSPANDLGALEFELIAHALSSGSCPLLQTLDLSSALHWLSAAEDGIVACRTHIALSLSAWNDTQCRRTVNTARAEGIARFCAFLRSPSARTLYALDLSRTFTLSRAHPLNLSVSHCCAHHGVASLLRERDPTPWTRAHRRDAAAAVAAARRRTQLLPPAPAAQHRTEPRPAQCRQVPRGEQAIECIGRVRERR